MKTIYKIIVLSFPLFILSCQKAIDFEAEKKKIQAQINLVEKAHYSKDANQFFSPNAESWYDVRQGMVSLLNKPDVIPSTQSYLDNMEFQEMVKRDDPIIEISNDGTLASYIGSVTVKGFLDKSPVFWVVSWQNVLKKINGEWKIISSVNTEANKENSATVLLKQVQKKLGNLNTITSIHAYAECTGPGGAFKTLVLSRKNDGRMEQISSNGDHNIFKYGKKFSWINNLNTKTLTDSISLPTKAFIQGHELHWLSFNPEDKYSTPYLKEITKFNDQTAFNIEFKDVTNKPVNFYYSFDTYIPLGFDILINDQGDIVTVLFKDWEEIDGISVFKNAIFKQEDDIFEYNFTNIEFNKSENQDFENKAEMIQ